MVSRLDCVRMSGTAEVHFCIFVQRTHGLGGEWMTQGFLGVEMCYRKLWEMSEGQEEDLIR